VALNGSVPISGWFWYSGQAAPDSAYVGGKLYGVMNGTGIGPWAEGNPQADFEFKTYVVPPPPPDPGGGSGTSPTGERAAALKKCKKKRSKKAKKKC
jgi:ABC-type glycerol-3-phosphate transport system substrate-binding protein